MSEFLAFHFDPLSYEQAAAALEGQADGTVYEVYAHWLQEFEHKSNLFYRVQFSNHQEWAIKDFCKQNNLDYDNLDYPYWARSAAAEHCDRVLYDHVVANDTACMSIGFLRAQFPIVEPTAPVWIMRETNAMETALDAAWFNTVIDTPPAQAAVLRGLPYGEYLQTPHWKRVRAAMILINRARCQGKCYSMGEGAWFSEHLIHVHHVSYKHRGNERYADLRLLCDRCHREIHGRAS